MKALSEAPRDGRPVEELPLVFREWVIEFGRGTYLAYIAMTGSRLSFWQSVTDATRHMSEAIPP